MAGVKALIALAFSGSIGMTLVILGCALPSYANWWPFFVVLFYILSPIPTMLARRYQDDMGSSNFCKEMALFLTAGIVVSAFGLPVVLAHAPPNQPVIQIGACILTLLGNVVTFLTILGFFIAFDNDDEGYSHW
ncbi:leptin receptor gene-related protein [Brevipalpus obovatus]|uniref:leptin receptor gene-related protein n=1 Tax=Brevipalpus obovatus TaxID=246614 RepID=UPI003D9F387D